MRIAIVTDIHGNRTAFEAVLNDLRQTSPDLILHGGDLADAGANPVEIVDCIRDLGWQGVMGNGEEALAMPNALEEFARNSPAPASVWAAVRNMMAATRELLGEERIAWLGSLPRVRINSPIALVHASPTSAWSSPGPEASDAELNAVYGPLGQEVAIYGHIHRPYKRIIKTPDGSEITVANTGSVSLSYDGDYRASYLLLDGRGPTIRRVEYDIDRELTALARSGFPHSEWIARTLRSASPQSV
jgi:predicted phosphodiesterase